MGAALLGGLLDRSLLGAPLRLWLGMPLEISVGDSLGCMDRLGSAYAIAEGMALGA